LGVANIPISLTVSGSAVLSNVSKTTNGVGSFSFTVTDSIAENVVVTMVTTSSDSTKTVTATYSIRLYFGATARADIDQTLIAADGQSGHTLIVLARDYTGIPLSNIPVILSFPANSLAVPTSANGSTDDSGRFTTKITDTVAETTSVTPNVGGLTLPALSMTFGSSTVSSPPAKIDLLVKSDNALSDGVAKTVLVVVARDAAGTPIPKTPISLSSDSATAVLRLPSGAANTLFLSTTTGDNGSFELSISDNVSETVNITATTVSASNNTTSSTVTTVTKTVPVKFVSQQASVKVAKIELDTPINNNQSANGTDAVSLRGRVLDTAGNPVSNIDVSVILSGGSAKMTLDNSGKTDTSGRFFASLTDTVVEQFTATAVIAGVSSSPVTVNFKAAAAAAGQTVPQSMTLFASPDKQLADGTQQITLIAIVRDASNTPMSKVNVVLSTTGTNASSAIFDNGMVTTDSAGTAIFKVKNSVSGVLNVTANVQGSTSPSASQSVSFLTAGIGVDNLTVSVLNDNQAASGDSKDAIKVNVIARDKSGSPVANAPIVLQMAANSSAVATPARGNTDANGLFTTSITSGQAGDVAVVVAVEGTSIVNPPVTLHFVASSSVTPASLDIQVSNSPQTSDGTSKVTLVAIPRDAKGVPVPGVEIQFVSTSSNAVFASTDGKGTTNPLGEFRTTVTDKVAESFNVTAVTTKTSIKSVTAVVSFKAATVLTPATLTLSVVGSNKLVGETYDISVVARDQSGIPMSGVPVVLSAVAGDNTADISGSAVFKGGFKGSTGTSGEFLTTVTNSSAGNFKVKAIVEGTVLSSNQVVVTFLPALDARVPASIVLTPSKNNVAVGNDISLTVLARDKDNVPMVGVPITLSASRADTPAGGTQPADVSGSVVFSGGFQGKTDSSGKFTTTVTNITAGSFKVKAAVDGGGPSSEIALTFFSDTQAGVAKLELLSSKSTLDSEGRPEGVIISARLKDASNSLIVGRKITFSTDSGDIQPVSRTVVSNQETYAADANSGVTDATGQAYARLTTVGNPYNRTITVTANSEDKKSTITVDVTGTTITISGLTSVVQTATQQFTIFLKNSAGIGIMGKALTVTSSANNAISAGNPSDANSVNFITDNSGQLVIALKANNAGTDTLSASIKDAPAAAKTTPLSLTVSTGAFTITANPSADTTVCPTLPTPTASVATACEVPLNQTKSFHVKASQAYTKINITTTRGTLNYAGRTGTSINIPSDTPAPPLTAPTDFDFTIRADNAGIAVITVTAADTVNAPSQQINMEFIATDVNAINVQVAKAVIGVNTSGSETEQTEVVAIVRDPKNNLVKGKVINFTLNDSSGGRLSQTSVKTDGFGRASTNYIAGQTTTAAGGAVVTATVADKPSVNGKATVTVAKKAAFISLGSGNKLIDDGGIRFKSFYTVLVTDTNGTPVSNVPVTLSVYTTPYYKGKYDDTKKLIEVSAICQNEDTDKTGIYTVAKDLNRDGILTPGNIVTVDKLNLTTDSTGYADFNVIYAKQYAFWVDAQITARALVAGTEALTTNTTSLVCSKEELDSKTCPVAFVSPFGQSKNCDDTL
jgi:adhesin/invasin